MEVNRRERCSSSIRSMIISPVRKSRLPVGSSASSTLGLPSQGARQNHSLLFAAGKFARAMGGPVALNRLLPNAPSIRVPPAAGFGYNVNNWKVWDSETSIWREKKIPVYPALGDQDLHGDENVALANYFQRFPDLKNSRYYSVRAANSLILVLDSSLNETSGPQGQWLTQMLDTVPGDVDFVFIVLHHPPYTSSSDEKKYGGDASRKHEEELAAMLEARQQHMNARFVVFSREDMYTITNAMSTAESLILCQVERELTPMPSNALPATRSRAKRSTITICWSRWITTI